MCDCNFPSAALFRTPPGDVDYRISLLNNSGMPFEFLAHIEGESRIEIQFSPTRTVRSGCKLLRDLPLMTIVSPRESHSPELPPRQTE